MTRNITYLIIIILSLTNCHSSKQEIQKIVNHWAGKEIVFSDSLAMKLFGKDTCADLLSAHKYKILNYIDTTGCGECQLRFYDWKRLQHQIDSLKADVGIVYVIFAKHYTPIAVSQKINKFYLPFL